jgi:hypothetical protein
VTTLVLAVEPEAVRVETDERQLRVYLADGRTISAPLTWYPRLAHASPEERAEVVITGGGFGLHWPRLDEDLHVEGLLAGRRSAESAASFNRWLRSRS